MASDMMVTATRRRRKIHAGLLTATLMLWLGTTPAQADDSQHEQGRAIVRDFGMQLQTALKVALEEGGPAAAIRVCKEIAPQIASELSRQNGVKVQRTSLRVRNPANLAEPWQVEVLNAFEDAADDDAELELEHFEAGDAGQPARYAKAIRTGAMCLVCHGAAVSVDVVKLLDSEYPFDRARGYELGDIRGAFSVTWPVN